MAKLYETSGDMPPGGYYNPNVQYQYQRDADYAALTGQVAPTPTPGRAFESYADFESPSDQWQQSENDRLRAATGAEQRVIRRESEPPAPPPTAPQTDEGGAKSPATPGENFDSGEKRDSVGIRGIMTILVIAAFVGFVWWTFHKAKKPNQGADVPRESVVTRVMGG